MSPGSCVETIVIGGDTSFASGSVQLIVTNLDCPLSTVACISDGHLRIIGGVVSTNPDEKKTKDGECTLQY